MENKNLSKIIKSNHSLPNNLNSIQKVLNKAFNSFNTFKQYNTALLNKQKITSQTISKHPSPDAQLISNNPFYSSFFDFNSIEKSQTFR